MDIFINLAESFENQINIENKLLHNILEQLKDKNKLLKKIENNQDYIKQQNNIILEKLKLPQNNQNIEKIEDSYKEIYGLLKNIERIILS